MRYYQLCFWALSLLTSTALTAQVQEVLFPGLSGGELIERLRASYKPGAVLNYRDAREKMYTSIWNTNDSVRCVYTDHALYLSPEEDSPIFQLSMFGSPNGIITEHIYPRSKGAEEGNALSDMHHLVPARLEANVARNNFPFGDIPDETTQLWFYRTTASGTKPTNNIDRYSEQVIGKFEPREAFKGNIARSVFYFFTMYQYEAVAADPEFFARQRADLCRWHELDPVDEEELRTTHEIAQYQDGKPNPFVLDCSLAFRTYCGDVQPRCAISTNTDDPLAQDYHFRVFPNPVASNSMVGFTLEKTSQVSLYIYDLLGRPLLQLAGGNYPPGRYEYPLSDLKNTVTNFLICKLIVFDGRRSVQLEEKIIFP